MKKLVFLFLVFASFAASSQTLLINKFSRVNFTGGQWTLQVNTNGAGTWTNATLSTDLATALALKADVSALAGKANTSHTHVLSDLTISGAISGQVPQWNGSAWVATT